MKFLKQHKSYGLVGQSIGGLYNQTMRTLAYWSVVNSVILLVLAWDGTLGQLIRGWFPWLTLPYFITIIVAIVLIIMVVDYLVILPGVYAFGNRQTAEHDNPIYKELKEFRKETKDREDAMQNTLNTLLAEKTK